MAGPPWCPWWYEVSSTKEKMLVVKRPPGVLAQSSRCLRRATDPTHKYICLGQFSAGVAEEVNKALVRGVHHPGPQPPIRKRQGSGAHMLRVQNQSKQAVSSGLPLAVVVARGDL
jgi:hypothetical protein